MQGAQPTVPGGAQAITPGTVAQGQITPGTVQTPAANERVANNQQGAAGSVAGGPDAGNGAMRFNPLNFQREINAKCVSLTEQQLDKKQGADFDRCFLTGQVAMHTDLLATLDVAKSQLSASSQLTPVINEAIEVAQKHLNRAETLLNQESQQKH